MIVQTGLFYHRYLIEIAEDLERIHVDGKFHKNHHGGNLLADEKNTTEARINDVGLHGPTDPPDRVIIRVQIKYRSDSDIYSFGIVMIILQLEKDIGTMEDMIFV